MKAFIAAAGFAAGASAAVVARDGKCCFTLTASGGASGPLSQLSDGQNRIGGSGSPATYCIDNGGITDSMGRGCILTPPTTQFQCDTGASPTTGFSISSSGEVEYKGSSTFYACPATDNGMYNIYTTPVANQPKCVKVELSTGGKCVPQKPTMPKPTMPKPSPSMPANTCPPAMTVTVTEKAPAPATVTVTEQGKCPAPTCPEMPAPTCSCPECPAPKCPAPTTVYDCKTSPMAPPPPETMAPPPETMAPPPETMAPPPETTMPPPPAPPAPMTTKVSPPPPGPYKPSQPVSMPSPPPSKPSGCPTDLSGSYQYPHLIVPVSSSQPDHAYGTQYNATITPSECTIFNFDIPQSYQGETCSVVFLFPEQSQLETSSYDFSGSGSLVFSSLRSPANQQTTWNNCPAKKQQLGSVSPMPGNSYSIYTGMCAAGTTQSIEVCGTNGLSLTFFEDYNPSPIGVYITSC